MSEKDPKNKKKKNGKRDWSFYAIIICLVIIAIPVSYVGYNAFVALRDRGRPILGHRFDGDLEPTIDTAAITQLKTAVDGLEGVESSGIELKTATLRITVKTADDASEKTIESLADAVYEQVVTALPVESYFTATDTAKMYDIEIQVANILKPDESQMDAFKYYLLSKTSNESEKRGQFVSSAIDQEFVDSLVADEAERKNKKEKEVATEESQITESSTGE